MDNLNKYTFRITWSEEDQEYLGLCAEFPSLSWLSDSYTEAFKGIREVVAEVVADLIQNNEEIPQPLSTKKYSGKFMVRIPPEQHRSLAIEAAEASISLNRLVSSKLK
jgi:predicted HicB family RNase H-like nuclease